MGLISSASEINALAEKESSSGVYFVTAFGGLLAPYWDTSAGGLLIGKCFTLPLLYVIHVHGALFTDRDRI